MEWLKEILEKAEIKDGKLDVDSIVSSVKAELDKITVSKDDYESTKAELETAKSTVTERDKQLAELKKSAGDNEELKTKIAELETANKTAYEKHKAELETLKINSAVEKALMSANAKNLTAVKALLKMENIKIDNDGKISGIDEQVKALATAEDTKFLFEETKGLTGIKPQDGNSSPASKKTSEMTYSEMCKYLEENPNAQI